MGFDIIFNLGKSSLFNTFVPLNTKKIGQNLGLVQRFLGSVLNTSFTFCHIAPLHEEIKQHKYFHSFAII